MKTIFLCLLLTVSAGMAAQPGAEAWLQNGLLTPELIAALKSDLALTPDQETRMTAIVTEAQAGAGALEKDLRDQQKAFNHLLRQRETTPEEAGAALARLMEAEAPVKQAQLRTLLRLRDLLTPDQLKKAVTLAPSRQAKRTDLETRVREKAARLKTAVDALGIPPTSAMMERGLEIEGLMRGGDLAAADKALDKLIAEGGLEDTTAPETPDFSKYEPGDTDVGALRDRLDNVLTGARGVIFLPKVRRLLKAKEALEQAKAAEDPVAVGRILTWAEGVLK